MDRESQDLPAPMESALDADRSLSRKLAERYVGEVRRSRPRVDSSMEASIEELPPETERP